MASLYDLSIDFTQGGNSTSEVWSLENKLWTGLSFTRSALDADMKQIFDYILPLLRPDIILKGGTLSKAVAKGEKKGKARDVLTFADGRAGTRVLANGAVPTELALGLRFEKDSETPGMPGHWLIRGTLVQGDIEIGKDGFYVLKSNFDMTAVTAFETAMTNDPSADFRLVLPAKGKDNFISGARNIHKWKCVGIGRKDLRKNRKTSREKQDDAARDEITPIFAAINRAIADGFQLQDFITASQVALRVQALMNKYSVPVVARIAVHVLGGRYPAVKALVPALPALDAVNEAA